MSFQPLLDAPLAVQFHVATVVPAALLGAFIFLRPKGTAIHRLLGKIWVVLMVATAASTFFIHELKVFYGFSPIHLLSIFTIYGCLQSIYFARRGDIRRHMRIMQSVYLGGIVIASFVIAMYATRLTTEVYHLVQPGGKYTVCGLRVSRVMSNRKANTLQLVHELPSQVTICKHCERIQGQDLKE